MRSLMVSKWRTNIIRFILTGCAAFCLTGFGSCSVSVMDVCTQRIPELDQRLTDAIGALAPWSGVTSAADRGPASVGLARGSQELSKADREVWESWAQARLTETQHYIDLSGEMPFVRNELTEIANQLVTFHGYAQSGRAGGMARVLLDIQVRSAKINAQVCSLNPAVK